MKKEVEDIVLKPEDIIGECDVDSGQIMIIDPCYVLSDGKYSKLLSDRGLVEGSKEYKQSDALRGHTQSDAWMRGVVVNSGGDGTYKVFAKIDEKTKRIKSVTIEFDHENLDRTVKLINKAKFDPMNELDDDWVQDN